MGQVKVVRKTSPFAYVVPETLSGRGVCQMQSWRELLSYISAVEGRNGDTYKSLVVRELVGTDVIGNATLAWMEFR